MANSVDMPTAIDRCEGLAQVLAQLGIGLLELIASMRDEIAVLDRQSRLVAALGVWPDELHPEDLLGRTLREMFDPQAAAVHQSAHARALRGEHIVYEWTRRKGRQSALLSTAATPLRDPSSNVLGVIFVTRNVAPSKRGVKWFDGSLAQKARRLMELEEGIHQLAGAIENYRKTEYSSRTLPADSPLHQLSSRERQVLDLLGQGYRPRSIAEKLQVSPETVRNHLKAMFKKTGTHSQEELMAILRESQAL